MNITDVDDKTITRATPERRCRCGSTPDRYTQHFLEDLQTLRIEPAWKYPRATEHIPRCSLIQTLMDKATPTRARAAWTST